MRKGKKKRKYKKEKEMDAESKEEIKRKGGGDFRRQDNIKASEEKRKECTKEKVYER